jgi:protein SDA1
VNKDLQGFMYVMLKDEHSVAAKKSLEVMVDLYRRRVWTDSRTVNVIATACLSSVSSPLQCASRMDGV